MPTADDLLKGDTADTLLGTPPLAAPEKAKHPWVDVTEAAMRAKTDPGAPLVPRSAGLGATAQEQAKNLQHPADLLATTAATIASPGLGLLGRVGAQTAAGGIRSASKGENPLWGAFVDALVTGASEGLMALVPGLAKVPKVTRSLGEMAEKVRSTRAGEASVAPRIGKAVDLIRKQLPTKPFLNVPALDKTKLLTLDEAAKALQAKGLTGEQFQIARAQLVHALNEAEKTGAAQGVRLAGQPAPTKPYAGSIFGKFAPKEHYIYRPTGAEQVAEDVVGGLASSAGRSLADIAANTDVGGESGNMPLGAVPILKGLSGLQSGATTLKGLAGRIIP